MKLVVKTLNSDNASGIEVAKTLFSNSEIEGQLVFIKVNLYLWIHKFTRESSLALVNKVSFDLRNVGGGVEKNVSK
mgnify:CR=1 FL=1